MSWTLRLCVRSYADIIPLKAEGDYMKIAPFRILSFGVWRHGPRCALSRRRLRFKFANRHVSRLLLVCANVCADSMPRSPTPKPVIQCCGPHFAGLSERRSRSDACWSCIRTNWNGSRVSAGEGPVSFVFADIECQGRKGQFPTPEQDSVIQIANYVVQQGMRAVPVSVDVCGEGVQGVGSQDCPCIGDVGRMEGSCQRTIQENGRA